MGLSGQYGIIPIKQYRYRDYDSITCNNASRKNNVAGHHTALNKYTAL